MLNSKTQRRNPDTNQGLVTLVRNSNHQDKYDGILTFAKATRKKFLYFCRVQEWAKDLYNGFRYHSGLWEHKAIDEGEEPLPWVARRGRRGLEAATKLWAAFKNEMGRDTYRKDFTVRERAWMDVIHSEKYGNSLWNRYVDLEIHRGRILRVRRPMKSVDFNLPFLHVNPVNIL
jgi:hypothetical protein